MAQFPKIPANLSPETLNFIDALLNYTEESLKERTIRVSTLKPLSKDGAEHQYIRAIGTNEIDRVFQNVHFQFECEAGVGTVCADFDR